VQSTPVRDRGEVAPRRGKALTAENAVDPEGAALSYRFEIDTAASFDTADLQVSPDVPESASETPWTPALPLLDNTHHYWRVAAFDGNSQGPWASASFFVNLGNDLPSSPVPLSPAEAAVVASTTPTLRVTNAQDLDNDALSYEFEVMDAVGAVVASATGVIEGPSETAWTVTAVLSENGEFTWHARAYDDEGAGAWSVQRSFRVNALDEPPSAPELVSPLEGTILDVRQVPLVVSNASSPEGRVLSYRFELYSVDDLGQQSLVAEVSGLPEGAGATQWSTGIDLGDGEYSWRARAEDGVLVGPWMASAHFAVAVDVAPSAPLNLEAVPGDTSVTLSWDASVEPDVFAYRVYRSLVSGAGYALVDEVAAAAYTDLGLTNGTTYFYVVTALDTQFESASSAEVAATPNAGPTSVPVDVRFDPWSIAGECLVVPGGNHDQHHHHRGRHSRHQCGFAHGRPHGRGADSHTGGGSGCPSWVFAKIVVPEGTNPYSVDVASIRLEGSVAPDPDYKVVHWHWRSVRVRFALWKLLPLLDLGANPLELTGRAGETDISGTGVLHVRPLRVALQIHPSVLESALVGTRHGDDDTVTAKLRFTGGVKAHDVDLDSLRLNGQVSVEELLSANGSRLRVTFDRDEVLATLPEGHWVEVTVSGEVGGIPFAAMDHVQVVH
jgi:hypothetical protein